MFSQLDQHGAFTPCCTRSASPFPSVSRVAGARPRSFDDLSLFLFRKPFLPPHAFAKVFLEVRTACEPSAKSKPFSLIARWKFHFGSLSASRVSRNCDPLNRAPLYGVPEHRQLFLLSSFVVCIIDEKKVSPLVLRTGTRYCSGRVYIYYLLFVPRRSIGWITLTASIVSFGICVRRLAFVSRSRAFQDSWFLSWPTYSPGFARND